MKYFYIGVYFLCSCLSVCLSERRHNIYWNTTNSIFQEENQKTWLVQADDTLNFICPNDHKSRNQILWSYREGDYENCRTGENVHPILDCSNSHPGEGFELNVFTKSMLPGTPVFETKKPVYFFAQSHLCQRKNMKVKIILKDPINKDESFPRVTEIIYNDDSSVSIRPPLYGGNMHSGNSFDKYRYLIIIAVFAGVLLVGIHIVLCLAWLPRRLKRNLSNLKNIENNSTNELEDSENHLIRDKSLFSNKTYSTPNNNPDVNETLRNLAYQQIKTNDLYTQNGPLLQTNTPTLAFPLPPNIYTTALTNIAGNQEFCLPDFTQQNQAALLFQQNEFQKQIQLQFATQLALSQQHQNNQNQQIYQITNQSIYDVPKDNPQLVEAYGTLNTPRTNKQKNSIATNPHHTSRRKKS